MKSLNVLKSLIDLFLFFSILGGLAILVILPIKLINPSLDVPISIKGGEIAGSDWLSVLVILLLGTGTLLFIYAIVVLRKVIKLFMRNEIFTNGVIVHFRTIGKCIIASALLTSLPMFFYNLITEVSLGIEFTGGFDSLLLSVSLGLLFIAIGEIFQKAKNIKEENELTV